MKPEHAFKALILFALPLYGDRLYLQNGDRLSGRVWKIDREEVLLHSMYGIQHLKRSIVKELYFGPQARRITLHLQDGRRFTGRLERMTPQGIFMKLVEMSRFFLWENIQSIDFSPSGTIQYL